VRSGPRGFRNIARTGYDIRRMHADTPMARKDAHVRRGGRTALLRAKRVPPPADVGASGIEPETSAMSPLRSYQLSYAPAHLGRSDRDDTATGPRRRAATFDGGVRRARLGRAAEGRRAPVRKGGVPTPPAAWGARLGAGVWACLRSAVVTSTRSTPSQPWQITWNCSGRRMGRATAWRYPQHSHVTMARISPLAPPLSSSRRPCGPPSLAEFPDFATGFGPSRVLHGTATRPLHVRVRGWNSLVEMSRPPWRDGRERPAGSRTRSGRGGRRRSPGRRRRRRPR
jgi:hypothetical protein